MKKTMMRMTMFAVAAMAALGADRMYFTTDFEFSVQGRLMPAGSYAVEKTQGHSAGVRIQNLKTKNGAFAMLPVLSQNKKNGPGTIEFACAANYCELAGVSQLREGMTVRPVVKPGARMVAIRLADTPAHVE